MKRSYQVVKGEDRDCLLACGPCADALKASGACADLPEGTMVHLELGTICQVHPSSLPVAAIIALDRLSGWEDGVSKLRRDRLVRTLAAPFVRVRRVARQTARAARLLLFT